MRRADRLLQIIQILRRSGSSITAKSIASELEVASRTIYRDIAALQASNVPIEGEAGVGYMLRGGYDLPPLMLTFEEVEALVVGARMVIARSDPEMTKAAKDLLAKISAVLPREISHQTWKAHLLVPHPLEQGVGFGVHVIEIRQAIRRNKKVEIDYCDLQGRNTTRTLWPLGLYFFSHLTLLCAWCEKRCQFRSFRTERVVRCITLEEGFDSKNGKMMQEFLTEFSAKEKTDQGWA